MQATGHGTTSPLLILVDARAHFVDGVWQGHLYSDGLEETAIRPRSMLSTKRSRG